MPLRVLVSRTDRIGDVVLTLPLCGLLKARLGADVLFLGRPYTRAVVEASDAVDEVLEWDDAASPSAQAESIAAARADVVLHVFPRRAVARAAWRAGVGERVGTSRRAYHWLYCNRRVPLARRGSPRHEAELNVGLARALLPPADLALSADALAPFGAIRPRAAVPAGVAPLLGPDRANVVLHPLSLGSAREWPLASYRALAESLPADRFRVLVTGSADEGRALADWLRTLPAHAHDLCGRLSLAELVAVLARASGVVAASTGPLHVAAAAGAPALGLYAPTPPVHPGRWRPLGPRASALVAPARCAACAAGRPAAGCACMGAISVEAVRARVLAWTG